MPSTDTQDNRERLARVESGIGHRFARPGLLAGALTHSSMPPSARRGELEHFERLEFLGDRVLGLTVAGLLLARFPEAPEGDLARRLALLVDRGTLAEVGRGLGLGAALQLSGGESKTGGAEKDTVLADAVEALIGAVYLDAGFDVAASIIGPLWAGRIDATAVLASGDPKTELQEWAQARGLALPAYREAGRSGSDHAPVFEIVLSIEGQPDVTAQGASKREAQKAAAARMLAHIRSKESA